MARRYLTALHSVWKIASVNPAARVERPLKHAGARQLVHQATQGAFSGSARACPRQQLRGLSTSSSQLGLDGQERGINGGDQEAEAMVDEDAVSLVQDKFSQCSMGLSATDKKAMSTEEREAAGRRFIERPGSEAEAEAESESESESESEAEAEAEAEVEAESKRERPRGRKGVLLGARRLHLASGYMQESGGEVPSLRRMLREVGGTFWPSILAEYRSASASAGGQEAAAAGAAAAEEDVEGEEAEGAGSSQEGPRRERGALDLLAEMNESEDEMQGAGGATTAVGAGERWAGGQQQQHREREATGELRWPDGSTAWALHVRGVSVRLSEEALQAAFADCGPILECRVYNKPWRRSMRNPFAFVYFQTQGALQKALQKSEEELHALDLGTNITIGPSYNASPSEGHQQLRDEAVDGLEGVATGVRLVGVPEGTSGAQVAEALGRSGAVTRVTGRGSIFYVHFATREEAAKALALGEVTLGEGDAATSVSVRAFGRLRTSVVRFVKSWVQNSFEELQAECEQLAPVEKFEVLGNVTADVTFALQPDEDIDTTLAKMRINGWRPNPAFRFTERDADALRSPEGLAWLSGAIERRAKNTENMLESWKARMSDLEGARALEQELREQLRSEGLLDASAQSFSLGSLEGAGEAEVDGGEAAGAAEGVSDGSEEGADGEREGSNESDASNEGEQHKSFEVEDDEEREMEAAQAWWLDEGGRQQAEVALVPAAAVSAAYSGTCKLHGGNGCLMG
eukprot:jgi/Mesen1/8940/ME000552S08449